MQQESNGFEDIMCTSLVDMYTARPYEFEDIYLENMFLVTHYEMKILRK